jgi:exodeoxyribonuclease VII large subunit
MPKDYLEFDFGPTLPIPPRRAGPRLSLSGPTMAKPVPAQATERVRTVTQLNRDLRQMMEGQLGQIWVRGEMSNLRKQASGHQYFTLKDAEAQISCVLFQRASLGLPHLQDGMEVEIAGQVSLYEPRGQVQIIVKDIQLGGQGLLAARFEALKRRLSAEGLFEASRKKRLPSSPGCLALITSPTGAAIQDMLQILGRRAPWIRLILCPVRVQGDGAAQEIAGMIRAVSAASGRELPLIDAIICGRGGGSLEDLWAFNEEVVARAIEDCRVPLVSAVGHEIDFSIADFVADLRAPTPSAAAELLAPDGLALRQSLTEAALRMRRSLTRSLDHAEQIVRLVAQGALIQEIPRRLELAAQRTDLAETAIQQAPARALETARQRLALAQSRLHAARPDHAVAALTEKLNRLELRLSTAVESRLTAAEERQTRGEALLNALAPQAVLRRGYSFTTEASGRVVARVADLVLGQSITTTYADGAAVSVVQSLS